MQADLESRGITTEFVDATEETVYVGFETDEIDSTNLFTELGLVVQVVLEHRPGTAVRGAIFHTERPVIGLWRVDETWAEQYRDGGLSETALLATVLHTLSAVSFT